MIGFAMAFSVTRSVKHWARFVQVTEYTLGHFKDAEHGGEWFGYLDRRGERTHRFKAGPYKGCFHVPRALMECYRILDGVIPSGV